MGKYLVTWNLMFIKFENVLVGNRRYLDDLRLVLLVLVAISIDFLVCFLLDIYQDMCVCVLS